MDEDVTMSNSGERRINGDQSSFSQPPLSPEQQAIYRWTVEEKRNVFFTGSAGSGKSFLIRSILRGFKDLGYEDDEIAVTATTGIAAYNIDGQTIHSFSGGRLLRGPIEKILDEIKAKEIAVKRWQSVKVLILDEISMLPKDILEKLEMIARDVRENDEPFGGIQLIFTGDFFQLPPVKRIGYAFDARCWNRLFERRFQVRLKRIFRQSDDTFQQMLEEVRFGRMSETTVRIFSSLSRMTKTERDSNGLIQPVKLFPKRVNVDEINKEHLRLIQRHTRIYMAEDHCTWPQIGLNRCFKDLLAPERLELKMGCRVMLIYNISRELVNGSIGLVLGFCSVSDFNILRNRGFDWSTIDPSRVKDDELMELMREKQATFEGEDFPVVRFMVKRGERDCIERTEILEREKWDETIPRHLRPANVQQLSPWTQEFSQGSSLDEGGRGEGQRNQHRIVATREQIPLILSYALTIHKAQGQTLPLVKTDLENCFAPGQVYVALSRAKSLDGLQILNFDPKLVKTDPRVIQFSSRLQVIE